MQRQKSDADYLKSDELGLVIAKGMAVMYKTNPKNPVDFLAKWLLNYSQVERAAEQKMEAGRMVEDNKLKHAEKLKEEDAKREAEKLKAEEVEKDKKAFATKVHESKDLSDQLGELSGQLNKYTSSTATYIGKLVSPKKPIGDEDDDTAHIDAESEKIVTFCDTDEKSTFMVDKVLKKDMGLTFDVFNDPLDEEGKPIEQTDPAHLLVKEVVREPRIHFYQVPKLGSYFAIRLEYNSCLFEDSFNEGVKDYMSMKQRLLDQEEAKRQHDDNQNDLQQQADANGDEFVHDPGNWPSIDPKAFKTQKVTFVVCLNTLGQDRCFTPEQIRYSLDQIKYYTSEWERIENDNLRADIERKLAELDSDRIYKETNEALDVNELEKRAEEATIPEEGKDPLTEDERNQVIVKTKFEFMTKQFKDPEGLSAHLKQIERERARNNASQGADRAGTPNTSQIGDQTMDEKFYPMAPEAWKQPVLDFKDLSIMKFPRVLQTLFYLLKYKREEVCERDTSKLDFKRTKPYIDEELFDRMSNYQPFGPNDSEFEPYQKLSFLTRNLETISDEQVDEFSIPLGKILRWVRMALDVRTEDVRRRKNIISILKHEREQALKADEDRTAKRQEELDAEKAVSDPPFQYCNAWNSNY